MEHSDKKSLYASKRGRKIARSFSTSRELRIRTCSEMRGINSKTNRLSMQMRITNDMNTASILGSFIWKK
jgi:hypothetical protein